MSEPIAKVEVRPLTAPEVPKTTAVAWAANFVEKSASIPVYVGRMAREELFRAAYAGIDWLEGTSQSSFKVMRETVRQLDQLSRHAIDGADSAVATLAKTFRGSSEAAGEVVSKTAVSLMGVKQA